MLRFCVANECDRLGTATYAPDADGWRPSEADRDYVLRDIERLRRGIAALLDDDRFALMAVIEPHKDGHVHVHFAFNRYIPKDRIAKVWGRGFVDLRRFRGPRTRDLGKRARCRTIASYMTSYLKKSFNEHHAFNRKRYSTTRGLAPISRQARSVTRRSAQAWQVLHMGAEPDRVWSSDGLEHWEGPPVLVAYWDG